MMKIARMKRVVFCKLLIDNMKLRTGLEIMLSTIGLVCPEQTEIDYDAQSRIKP